MVQRFLPGASRGGVGHFTHGLANALTRRGHAVTVFGHDPAPPDAAYHVARVGAPGRGRLAPLAFPFALRAQRFVGFDVVHAQGDDQWLRRAGVPPVVRTLHGSSLAEAIHNGWRRGSAQHGLLHAYFYACEVAAVLRARLVVAVSRDTARYYPRVHRVIPNGVDLEAFAPAAGERSPRPSILFVGELDTRKRGRLLLRAFAERVRAACPAAELWAVCPERAEGPGVRWLGQVSAAELARLYGTAWVFCLPSSYEGFGRPYVEAMAAGAPVVATPNAGAREILEDGRHGLLVREADLGEALAALLARADLRQLYADRGRARARRYGWDIVAEQYEDAYDTARGRAPSPSAA